MSLFITLLKIVSLLPPDDFHELMNKYHDFNFVLSLTSDTSGDNSCAHLWMVTRRLSWIGFGGTSRVFRSIVLPPYRLFIISIFIVMHDRDQILRFLKISPPESIRIPITWSTRHEFDGDFLEESTDMTSQHLVRIEFSHGNHVLSFVMWPWVEMKKNDPFSVQNLKNRPVKRSCTCTAGASIRIGPVRDTDFWSEISKIMILDW